MFFLAHFSILFSFKGKPFFLRILKFMIFFLGFCSKGINNLDSTGSNLCHLINDHNKSLDQRYSETVCSVLF